MTEEELRICGLMDTHDLIFLFCLLISTIIAIINQGHDMLLYCFDLFKDHTL